MREIKKILIANRGEVALRIIRTCKEMGIKTAALCPMAGQENYFLETKFADEYYFLEKEGSQGYLDPQKIIEIAKKCGADAIHPGYGFLSENWKFAELCGKNGIKFIGPDPEILKIFEDKIASKKAAKAAGLPTLPASEGSIKTQKDLIDWVEKIKPPFVLKAQRGGGGIGIRVVNGQITVGEISSISSDIQRQMSVSFADADFFLEKYLSEARHIEFQILGDGKNVVHLGERECTIQRRFQKLFEEAPSPFMTPELRKKMGTMAVKLGRDLKYEGAATVEFLVDKDRNFYFMEVNPRLQVEHPVTEAVTGIDIVEQQIRIARGEKLQFQQSDIVLKGWAVEARINAEDPQKNFQPGPGTVSRYLPPGGQGIFMHTFLQTGQKIYPYFDSMLAKLIALGKTREEAVNKLKRALDELIIEGVPTTIPFFKMLVRDELFLKGEFYTNFIERKEIAQKLSETPAQKICEVCEFDEKDIARITFQIYKEMKKNNKPGRKQGSASNWVMAQRLKMLGE
ncbi:MAG: biotin carboxylase N-terminal domain-containing protein [Candidatus Paceibacterota bacterium]|jgi:acetyl/propionyl-CoA carboxylase alpha subunit